MQKSALSSPELASCPGNRGKSEGSGRPGGGGGGAGIIGGSGGRCVSASTTVSWKVTNREFTLTKGHLGQILFIGQIR